MASLQRDPESGRYRIRFYHGDREYKRSIKTKDERVALSILGRVEETLRLVEQGRIDIPEDADIGAFILADGKPAKKREVEKIATLGDLFECRQEMLPPDSKEANTLSTERIHFAHLGRVLGGKTPLRTLTVTDLQRYVNARYGETWRGKPIRTVTIKKEIDTLRAVWNWASQMGLVKEVPSFRGLTYSKTDVPLSFRTWDEIERTIGRGGLDPKEVEGLWDSLFLTVPQIEEVLDFVRERDRSPFVYPMFAFVAHTGARRSELLRSRVQDFNFEDGFVQIREKKKDRSKTITYRKVNLTPRLGETMQDWFGRHPGGAYTLCIHPDRPLAIQTAAKAFRSALSRTKWEKIRGFHAFRHSFASNLALHGIDQGVIDEWLGHQTEEMRKRYRHLFPDQRRKAIESVFSTNG